MLQVIYPLSNKPEDSMKDSNLIYHLARFNLIVRYKAFRGHNYNSSREFFEAVDIYTMEALRLNVISLITLHPSPLRHQSKSPH
jgi:hypothetical protein